MLAAVIGLTPLPVGVRRGVGHAVIVLALASAAGLTEVEVWYAARDVVVPVKPP